MVSFASPDLSRTILKARGKQPKLEITEDTLEAFKLKELCDDGC